MNDPPIRHFWTTCSPPLINVVCEQSLTSVKGLARLGGLKKAIFSNVHYCIYAEIVDGSKKVIRNILFSNKIFKINLPEGEV